MVPDIPAEAEAIVLRCLEKAPGKRFQSMAELGEALAVEHEVEMPSWGYDEDFVWAVIGSITGRTHELEATYQVYAVES